VSASDQSISRVNYFNGQRLDADDFRADQNYQMAVRRALYSALYPSGGVVKGLEVTPHPTDQHKVIVAPGVALDFLGREIILLSATPVIAAGTPTTNPAAIFGNYLVISYTEQRTQAVSDGCNAGNGACGGNLAWGAATRIVAQPALQFTDTFPAPGSGQIVLAQVALGSGCQVGQIESGVRQYAVPAKPPVTRAISLEGEKDIDPQNPKVLYFHIDGSSPSTVTLYLRAAQFSSLYYTELGQHTHDNTVSTADIALPDHKHGFESIVTGDATQDATKPVTVMAWVWNDATDLTLRAWGTNDGNVHQDNLTTLNPLGRGSIVELQNLANHTHSIPAGTTDPAGGQTLHFDTTIANVPAGQHSPTNQGANSTGKWLSYVDKLTVWCDGTNITDQILEQLAGNDPTNWGAAGTTLGNGNPGSPLVTNGTGPIALDKLGLDFNPGQHILKFQVANGGGQIQYNLYVG
jgi:hypothetical protein